MVIGLLLKRSSSCSNCAEFEAVALCQDIAIGKLSSKHRFLPSLPQASELILLSLSGLFRLLEGVSKEPSIGT